MHASFTCPHSHLHEHTGIPWWCRAMSPQLLCCCHHRGCPACSWRSDTCWSAARPPPAQSQHTHLAAGICEGVMRPCSTSASASACTCSSSGSAFLSFLLSWRQEQAQDSKHTHMHVCCAVTSWRAFPALSLAFCCPSAAVGYPAHRCVKHCCLPLFVDPHNHRLI